MTPISLAYIQSYKTPFKRHLAYLDRDQDGYIYFGDSLRGALSVGLNFPASVIMATGIQVLYGNTRPFFVGPFRGIEIDKVRSERTMLEDFSTNPSFKQKDVFERSDLMAAVADKGLMDRFHIWGVWAIAANRDGLMGKQDVILCQKGLLFPELHKRRQDQDQAIPFLRGGPGSVTGHAWAVEKVFGVKVYQHSSASTSKDR